jgi:branched-chain amino acid transport system permease protein
VILLTVVGGIGTLWGPVVGPVILIPLGEILRIRLIGLPGLHLIIYGIVVVVILLGLRQGLVPWFIQWRERNRRMENGETA